MNEPINPFLRGTAGAEAIIPGRVARIIERAFPDISRLRTLSLGKDMEVYFALDALHRSALDWRVSATGNDEDPTPEIATRSEWLSTTQAAGHLHLGDRAVRIACAEGRIPAQKVDGRWRISRTDLANYRATHTIR